MNRVKDFHAKSYDPYAGDAIENGYSEALTGYINRESETFCPVAYYMIYILTCDEDENIYIIRKADLCAGE